MYTSVKEDFETPEMSYKVGTTPFPFRFILDYDLQISTPFV